LIFQDLDPGEALSAEAKLRPTEGGGKDLPVRRTQTGPPEAKSFGKSSAVDLKPREMPSPKWLITPHGYFFWMRDGNPLDLEIST
jgi:hypothetical protein